MVNCPALRWTTLTKVMFCKYSGLLYLATLIIIQSNIYSLGIKSKIFVKIFHQVFSTSTDFQHKDGQQIKILHLKYLESQ